MQDYQVAFRRFSDADSLAASLARFTAETLYHAVAKRGVASLVVSGGSTPVPYFQALSLEDLPWQKVFITLADERWVDTSDQDSNEKLVRRYLLQNQATVARFIGLKTEEATARAGEKGCEKRLKCIPCPYDLLVLGMGNDGHTASLFPGSEELATATDLHSGRLCQSVNLLAASHERMTMTLPALLDCTSIMLHITGRQKLQIFEKALAVKPVSVDILNEMPIRHVLARALVTVYWAP